MQDTLISVGCIVGALLLGQVDGLPTSFRDVGVVGILGFVVYYTLTKLNAAMTKLSDSLDNLKNVIENDIKTSRLSQDKE